MEIVKLTQMLADGQTINTLRRMARVLDGLDVVSMSAGELGMVDTFQMNGVGEVRDGTFYVMDDEIRQMKEGLES